MPHRAAMASTLLLGISLSAAWAADQNVWDECNQTGDTGASIAACTQILQAPGAKGLFQPHHAALCAEVGGPDWQMEPATRC